MRDQLAFELIPRLNRPYWEDTDWPAKRVEVISDAMQTLTDRYQRMLTVLQEKLLNTPTANGELDR